MIFLLISIALVTQSEGGYYRLMPASLNLKVESCRSFETTSFGDPEGSCQEQGFAVECINCHNSEVYYVKDQAGCTQESTNCYFRQPTETCQGISLCGKKQQANSPSPPGKGYSKGSGSKGSGKMHYRIKPPSGKLTVHNCREIADSLFGDPVGTCQEQGYSVPCHSCGSDLLYFVQEEKTCNQQTTNCYFRSAEETCVGISQCKHFSPSPAQMWHRVHPGSGNLPTENCINIGESMWGDPVGSCEENGYSSKCISCGTGRIFHVKEPEKCTQKATNYYFRSATETCMGMSQIKQQQKSQVKQQAVAALPERVAAALPESNHLWLFPFFGLLGGFILYRTRSKPVAALLDEDNL